MMRTQAITFNRLGGRERCVRGEFQFRAFMCRSLPVFNASRLTAVG